MYAVRSTKYSLQLTLYSVLRVEDLINEGGWCLRSGTMYGVLGVLRMVDRVSIFKTLSPAVHSIAARACTEQNGERPACV